MIKNKITFSAILDYWNPNNKIVVCDDGYRYFDTKSVITGQSTITGDSEISIFEQFYKLNNSLRYCNGSYYKFQQQEWKDKYDKWLKSDDYKSKSFNLFYGGGVVD